MQINPLPHALITTYFKLPLVLVTGVLDISSTGDGSTVCELTLSGID